MEKLEVWRLVDQDNGDTTGIYLTDDPDGVTKCMKDAENAIACDEDDPILKELGWDAVEVEVNGIMETFEELIKIRKITCIASSETRYYY